MDISFISIGRGCLRCRSHMAPSYTWTLHSNTVKRLENHITQTNWEQENQRNWKW